MQKLIWGHEEAEGAAARLSEFVHVPGSTACVLHELFAICILGSVF